MIISICMSASGTYTGMQTTGLSPGYLWNPVLAQSAGGYCTEAGFWESSDAVRMCDEYTQNETCTLSSVCGCSWNGSLCEGGFQHCMVDDADVKYNQSLCLNLGLIWLRNNETSQMVASSYNWGSTKSVFSAMFGWGGGSLGYPAGVWSTLLYLLFTWIPFAMLIWAIYMALPFAH